MVTKQLQKAEQKDERIVYTADFGKLYIVLAQEAQSLVVRDQQTANRAALFEVYGRTKNWDISVMDYVINREEMEAKDDE